MALNLLQPIAFQLDKEFIEVTKLVLESSVHRDRVLVTFCVQKPEFIEQCFGVCLMSL